MGIDLSFKTMKYSSELAFIIVLVKEKNKIKYNETIITIIMDIIHLIIYSFSKNNTKLIYNKIK